MIWHLLAKGESYVWARPSLHAKKLRDLELKAGHKAARGQNGAAHAYNIKSHREEERRWVEQAELAYARFVAGWNPRGPKRVRTGAATRCGDRGCAAGLPRPALHHAVTRTREENIADRNRKLLSITSLLQGSSMVLLTASISLRRTRTRSASPNLLTAYATSQKLYSGPVALLEPFPMQTNLFSQSIFGSDASKLPDT